MMVPVMDRTLFGRRVVLRAAAAAINYYRYQLRWRKIPARKYPSAFAMITAQSTAARAHITSNITNRFDNAAE